MRHTSPTAVMAASPSVNVRGEASGPLGSVLAGSPGGRPASVRVATPWGPGVERGPWDHRGVTAGPVGAGRALLRNRLGLLVVLLLHVHLPHVVRGARGDVLDGQHRREH